MDNYKGDTPGKEMAREWAYAGVKKFGYHIVMAGFCGDVKYHIQNGTPRDHIIACDKDPVRLEEARKLGCTIPPDYESQDIIRTIQWCVAQPGIQNNLASINIDPCASIIGASEMFCDAYYGNTSRNISGLYKLENPPRMILTFMRGHDPGLGYSKKEKRNKYVSPSPGQKRINYFNDKTWNRRFQLWIQSKEACKSDDYLKNLIFMHESSCYLYNSNSPMCTSKFF